MQNTVVDRARFLVQGATRPETLGTLALVVLSIAGALALLRFQEEVRRLGEFGYVGAFVLALVGNALVAVPFPWIFPVAAMGTVYSPIGIVAAAAAGAACGEAIPYLLGRGLARSARPARLARWLESMSGLQKSLVLVGLAFSPVLSYPGLAAGVLRYPAWATLGLTLIAEGAKVWLFIHGIAYVHRLHVF